MGHGRMLGAAFLACGCVTGARAQEAAPALSSSPAPSPAATITLTVPGGTVLQVALAKEVRLQRVGQPLPGLLVEPVYVFDEEVLPAGTEVLGRLTALERVPGGQRFWAALNADFSPPQRIRVEFHEVVLPGGQRLPLKSVVAPGSGRVVRLVTTADSEKKQTPKDAAVKKIRQAVAEAKRKWQTAMQRIKQPGKMRRLARLVLARLPVHPQYIDAGTVYFAELTEPLDFGSKPLPPPPALASAALALPPCNFLAHAQLETPLSSATAQKDAPVEAVLSQPVFSGERLIFPQGSRLRGSVLRARPARRLARHGELRFGFRELVPPGGTGQEVDASLEGVQTDAAQFVKLDSEGGAQTTAPRRRYALTGLSVALAVSSYEDHDEFDDGVAMPPDSGNASQGALGGAAGFRLVGIVVGALAHSRPLSLGLGLYGAGRSGYSHFLARGREVTFPKGTAMEIGFWLRRDCSESAPSE